MAKRIITSIIGVPILIALIYIGGVPLQIAVFLLALIGMTEMYNALSNNKLSVHYIGYAYAAVYFLFINELDGSFNLLFNSLFILSVLIFLVFNHPKINILDCAVTFFGFFYVAYLLSYIYLIRMYAYGNYFVWLVFICAFGSDTFALFVGLKFGKHKLMPELSPKKTIEGAVGGVIGATFIAFIYGIAMTKLAHKTDIGLILNSTIIGGAGSVFAMLGDLSASSVKRFTNIKDFGKIIPGHGGVLDRFDSVIFTAPAVYAVMVLLIRR